MLSMKTILENLTGPHVTESFVQWLAKESEDFAADHHNYLVAIDALRRELGDAVTDEIDAIVRQSTSNLLFSAFLGLKANLDNFINPVARNFLDVDFEVYLREETSHRLPEYEHAQNVRGQFYSLLTPAQKETYADVVTYTCHLETVGPKLAHYCGYMLGNELLPWVIPGYHADFGLTMRYIAMLEEYFGKGFLPTVL